MASEQMVLEVHNTVTGVPEDIAMQGLVEKATDGLTPESITSKFNFSRENLIEIGIYFGIGFVAGFLIKKYSHLIVGIGCDRPWGDAEPCLHLLEPGTKIGGSESLDAEFVPPVIERRVWSAKAGRPIDRGSPADTASLKDVDRFVLGLSARRFLVELRIGLGFEHVKVRGSRQRTFLDKHDLESGTAQYFRGGAAARAGTYDGDVGVE